MLEFFKYKRKLNSTLNIFGLRRLVQVRGVTEDLAEGVVKLRRSQTEGYDKEIDQSRLSVGLKSDGLSFAQDKLVLPD